MVRLHVWGDGETLLLVGFLEQGEREAESGKKLGVGDFTVLSM